VPEVILPQVTIGQCRQDPPGSAIPKRKRTPRGLRDWIHANLCRGQIVPAPQAHTTTVRRRRGTSQVSGLF
jgi:hypothetical protein